MEGQVYVNGRFYPRSAAAVSVFDHGLLYGDGVFEGMRAYSGRVFKLPEHLQRLYASARATCLDIGMPPAGVQDIVLATCRENRLESGYIRLVITRGVGDLGVDPRRCAAGPSVICIAEPALDLYGKRTTPGLRVATVSIRRVAPDALSPSIKSLNYLNNVLAKIEASQKGADEAIMLDAQGSISEGTVDNLFIVRGTRLVTPWTFTNLAGITRELIIELARGAGYAVEERPFSLYDVWTADEVFLTGTAIEVQPVIEVDGRPIGTGAVGPVALRLVTMFHEHARTHGTPIWTDSSARVA